MHPQNTIRQIAKTIKRTYHSLKPFEHDKAQEYELNKGTAWIKENFLRLYPHVTDKSLQKEVISDEFFKTKEEWQKFVDHIDSKVCLEIGSGPAGALIRWYWTKERIIIEPLIDKYKQISMELYLKSWFTPDMKLYAQNAEEFLPQYEQYIDGVIVCRNALDHAAEPYKILENIALYAKPSCYLLLWTDLYHLSGRDKGHNDITRDKERFAKHLKQLGFRIEFEFADDSRDTIQYGCRAVKT